MGLRSFLGLCDHKWVNTGDMIRHSRQNIVTPSKPIVTGFSIVRECEKCGAVKAFKL